VDLVQTIEAKYQTLAGRLDEAKLRLWVAAEARSIGRGAVSVVAKAAGAMSTLYPSGFDAARFVAVIEGELAWEIIDRSAGQYRPG
jgi:hypothetical protein